MHGERYIFCATIRQELLPARALPGALPSGVRTFLPPPPFGLRRGKPLRATSHHSGTEAGDRLADCDAIDYRAPAAIRERLTAVQWVS